MNKSKLIFAGGLLALLTFTLLFSTTSVFAKKDHPKPNTHVRGTITALDTTAGTITIQDKKSGDVVTVTADESTRIHKNNNESATLADLAVGDKAHARYNQETLVAKRIQAKSPKAELDKVHGTITAIDGPNVTVAPKKGDPVTVVVTEATKVSRDDVAATLADLVVGDRANAKYDPNTMEATKLNASSASDE